MTNLLFKDLVTSNLRLLRKARKQMQRKKLSFSATHFPKMKPYTRNKKRKKINNNTGSAKSSEDRPRTHLNGRQPLLPDQKGEDGVRPGGLRVHVGGARGAGERARPQALHGLVQRGHGAGGDARHVNPSAGVLVDADAALAAAGLRGGGGG